MTLLPGEDPHEFLIKSFTAPTTSVNDESRNSNQPNIPVEDVLCEQSKIQAELYNEIGYLMSVRTEDQSRLKRLLCNHPFLLYQRVMELASYVQHRGSKKARKEYVNFSGVLSKVPTRYDMRKCEIADSGKMLELFKIIQLEAENETNTRLIVITNYNKTLQILSALFDILNTVLGFSIYKICNNMPVTVLRDHVTKRVYADEGRVLILMDGRTDHLPLELFSSARIIFYDFEWINDTKSIVTWSKVAPHSIQRLITKGTIEEEDLNAPRR